jgi:hypothetical protein
MSVNCYRVVVVVVVRRRSSLRCESPFIRSGFGLCARAPHNHAPRLQHRQTDRQTEEKEGEVRERVHASKQQKQKALLL